VEERKTLLHIEDVADDDFFVALAVLSWPTSNRTSTLCAAVAFIRGGRSTGRQVSLPSDLTWERCCGF